jgi:hypothetical protein
VSNASREQCELMVKAFGRRVGFPAFLIDHAREFEPDARTFKGRRMRPGYCFENATKMAMRRPELTYVEGYVNVLIPTHHAWLMRPDGSIIDPTLNPVGLYLERPIDGYFGVPFSTEYLIASVIRNTVYGLLDGMGKASLDLVTGKTPVEEFLWRAP